MMYKKGVKKFFYRFMIFMDLWMGPWLKGIKGSFSTFNFFTKGNRTSIKICLL